MTNENEVHTPREIGNNIPATDEEREENLLKELYLMWRNDEALCPSQITIDQNITRRELNTLVRHMVAHGYLYARKPDEALSLTPYGKAQGAQCLARHRYLTQFIGLLCGMDERKALENAHRLEHVVNKEVLRGICEFMKYGDTYDRVVKDMDLCAMYEAGTYEFSMCLYRTNKRNPRILAAEFSYFFETISLRVHDDKSSFYLRQRDADARADLWYMRGTAWHRAAYSADGYEIPTDIFTYTIGPGNPVTEGDGIIAFYAGKDMPPEESCRELNVHIW